MLKVDNKDARSLSTSWKSETRNRNLKRCGIINNYPVKKKLASSNTNTCYFPFVKITGNDYFCPKFH